LTVINDDTGAKVASFIIERNVIGTNGTYRSFFEKPNAGDSDYLSNTSDTDNVYYVQFFATAYGLNLSDFSDLYGDVVYLHRIALNL